MQREILLHDAEQRQWLGFQNPIVTVTASRLDEVCSALQRVEAFVEEKGLFAAGFVAYEAATAFDPACSIHLPSDLPLIWFGLFLAPHIFQAPTPPSEETLLKWQPTWNLDEFTHATREVHSAIAAGETYQVNLTFPLIAPFSGHSRNFFNGLVHGQNSHYAAYLDLGRHVICSASPELFFRLDGRRLVMRPMKGTMARGLTADIDIQQAQRLQTSTKDHAENIMILDMVRNDLGRLAGPGDVRTTSVCALEKYPTVWQMTSTVEAKTDAPFSQIMAALFPCASITGAPKYRTTAIIKRLEKHPRGIYTGCIGYLAPGRKAQFSVAIRTAHIDRQKARASYGVGAGITWDSRATDEYRECLDKARILTRPMPGFNLFETLLWQRGRGYSLRQEHIDRLSASADYFGYPCRPDQVHDYLQQTARDFSGERLRVRLFLAADGSLHHEAIPFLDQSPDPVRLRLAHQPIDRTDLFCYHKTTVRTMYDAAFAAVPDCDDVILWNRDGEATETTIANLVFDLNGTLVTPPVACGLLPGTFRSRLLADKIIRERIVSIIELRQCRQIFLVNALRGWRSARILED